MFAKSVRPPPGVPHICYCHTPPRFLWDLRESAVAEIPRSAPIRAAVSAMLGPLRRADLKAAAGVTTFVANSQHVARRIRRYYQREASVVHPPVEINSFSGGFDRGDHFLILSRLYAYKRVDVAIRACAQVGVPLKIAGEGDDRGRLEAMAGPSVEFLGHVSEDEKIELLGSARGLLSPQVEDFGIAMVEAIAAGTPVISINDGGACEIVVHGETGVLYNGRGVGALAAAIREARRMTFSPDAMSSSVARFAPECFDRAMRRIIVDVAGGR